LPNPPSRICARNRGQEQDAKHPSKHSYKQNDGLESFAAITPKEVHGRNNHPEWRQPTAKPSENISEIILPLLALTLDRIEHPGTSFDPDRQLPDACFV
jgi:hypothetical protein